MYGLFNDGVCSTDYVALNDTVINILEIILWEVACFQRRVLVNTAINIQVS
jgi:hypothetical protein